MLTAFMRAFRTPDLRKKLLFTIFIIAVFRLGQQLPTPSVSSRGITTARSCRMMLAVMYGIIPSAKTVSLLMDPPLKRFPDVADPARQRH